MNKKTLINKLINNPVEYAHILGFTKLTELHNEWIKDMIMGKEDESLEAHRGSYKTTCVSFAIALIMILLPKLRIMFMRKTDDDVKEVVKQVQKILLDPHTQYIVFCLYGVELRFTVQSTTELNTNLVADVKGTSQLVGIGTGASLTGKHFDRIFTDDIINIRDRVSKAERDRTKLIYQELQNIKNKGGRIFNTLTPWHKDDASSIMPEPKKYSCYDTGLITPEELEEIKSKMLPSLFAANYELRHVASEDVIFTEPNTGGNPGMVEQGMAHIDAAFGGEDYTAFTIMRKAGGKYYIFGKLWHKHVENCYSDIKRYYAHFMCGKMPIEDNGDKGFTARDLKKEGIRAYTYHESMNKHIKITTYLLKIWDDVIFVDGTDEEYINQICDYNEDAEHDDAPDSASSLARLLLNKNETNYQSILQGGRR
jgi:phage terminase large subunit-like protein